MKKVILYILLLSNLPLFAQELPLVVQGVLKSSEGTALPEGKYTLTFRLYLSNEADAQAIWAETQPDVILRDGVYSVPLGMVNPLRLPFDRPYFLGVSLGDGQEFLPRSELTAAPAALFASRGGGGVEPGMIVPFAGYLGKIPFGWFPCDGRALKSADYPALFAIIGTVYGNGSTGPGSGMGTDFNLPNLTNQFLRGINEGRIAGVNRTLGSKEGFATSRPKTAFNVTTSSSGVHNHSFSFHAWLYTNTKTIPNRPVSAQQFSVTSETSNAGNHSHNVTSFTGGDSETRPRNRAMIYCIKF